MAKITYKTKMALTIAIVFWASAFVGIRLGLDGYSPGCMALFRFAVASICMLVIYLRLPKNRNKITLKDGCLMLLAGAITLGGYHYTLNVGELTVPTGIASFIITQMPVLTTIIAIIFLGERINGFGMFGLAISCTGMILISFGQSSDFTITSGIFYVLAAAIAGSVYTVLQKPFLKKYHAIDVTTFGIWGGTLALMVFAPGLPHEIAISPMKATLATVYLGIFPAAISYAAWNYALAAIPASRATNFMYFMPVISIIIGWICLGEVLTWLALVGGGVALIGVWMVNESFNRAAAQAQQPVKVAYAPGSDS